MPRKRPLPKSRRAVDFPAWADLDAWLRFRLEFAGLTEMDGFDVRIPGFGATARGYFESPAGHDALDAHIASAPGSRPLWWWRMSAPWPPPLVVDQAGSLEIRQSQASYLAERGELTPAELALWKSGKLPATDTSSPCGVPYTGMVGWCR